MHHFQYMSSPIFKSNGLGAHLGQQLLWRVNDERDVLEMKKLLILVGACNIEDQGTKMHSLWKSEYSSWVEDQHILTCFEGE